MTAPAGPGDAPTDDDALVASWRAEEVGQPPGWDFTALSERMSETPEPWNLDKIWRDQLKLSRHVLDMGTGGGEFLSSFASALPSDTVATEGWPPNLPVARERLTPHGITVVQHDSDHDMAMPFPDRRFDLVLNRHEGFDAAEVERVLVQGGVFVTQQVGGLEMGELHELTGKEPDNPDVTLRELTRQLTAAGLEVVDDGEDRGWYEFVDVAALVAYLQLVPWDVPDDFSVDRYLDALWELHRRGPARGEPVQLTRIRFWLRARKPLD